MFSVEEMYLKFCKTKNLILSILATCVEGYLKEQRGIYIRSLDMGYMKYF